MSLSDSLMSERLMGRVDEVAGEYAHALFARVFGFPFVTFESFWVHRDATFGETRFAIETRWHSVLSVYLRWYAAPLALALLLLTPLTITATATATAVLVALVAYTFRWRRVRDPLALRRAELNRVAFGTRCEPAAMFPEMRAALATELRTRWLARTPPPLGTELDTARDGTDDFAEYILAYGLLALTGAGPNGEAERAAADRLLQTAPAGLAELEAPALSDAVLRASSQASGSSYISDGTFNLALGAVTAAVFSIGGLVMEVPLAAEPTPTHVAEITADTSGLLAVSCDSQLRSTQSVLCFEAGATIAVKTIDAELPTPVVGDVRERTGSDAWFDDVRHNAKVAPVYLHRVYPGSARVIAAVAAALGILAIVLARLALRAYRRGRHTPRR